MTDSGRRKLTKSCCPFYSEEWTNRNPSDPGITILENLTAFEALQQRRIWEITPAVVRRLLKLAGFEARKGRCARLLLAPGSGEQKTPLLLPANQQFWLGDLCYETNRNIRLPACRLTGVYQGQKNHMHNVSYLLAPRSGGGADLLYHRGGPAQPESFRGKGRQHFCPDSLGMLYRPGICKDACQRRHGRAAGQRRTQDASAGRGGSAL